MINSIRLYRMYLSQPLTNLYTKEGTSLYHWKYQSKQKKHLSLNCESSPHDSFCIFAGFVHSMFIQIWNMYRGMRDTFSTRCFQFAETCKANTQETIWGTFRTTFWTPINKSIRQKKKYTKTSGPMKSLPQTLRFRSNLNKTICRFSSLKYHCLH